jgi:2-C-methyl-D-erythritol 4-phosphate cytidylyltransferase
LGTQPGKVVAIVVAAGCGKRMGRKIPKQFLEIRGKPIVVYTLEKFDLCAEVDEVILVVQAEHVQDARNMLNECGIRKVCQVVAGGPQRQDSVQSGLKNLPEGVEIVIVHDAVRPFVSVEKIEEVVEAARDGGAAVLATHVKDTTKRGKHRWVEETLDRDDLWHVQTPQCFRVNWIAEGYERARQDGYSTTDDAALVERLGYRVKIVEGEDRNIKITSPVDLFLAEIYVSMGDE